MQASILYTPIGIMHTPYAAPDDMPIQPAGATGVVGSVEIFEPYAAGLKDLDGFSHLILLYHFHQSRGFDLHVVPFLDDTPRGVFATRAPRRPNAIGLSVVKLLAMEGRHLQVEGVDMLDRTPVLDIKPHVPDFDMQGPIRIGWLAETHREAASKRSDRRFQRHEEKTMTSKPTAAGKSSFELIETERLFAALDLKENTSLLDLACGRGAYALAASRFIGRKGRICALDLWEEGIAGLRREAAAQGIDYIEAQVADVGRRLPLEDRCVDVCLMATVLHDLIQDRIDQSALKEVVRVLKDRGTLALVEFKKTEGPPGPPLRIRLSPEESAAHLQPYGFTMTRQLDIGPYNYLALFTYRDSMP